RELCADGDDSSFDFAQDNCCAVGTRAAVVRSSLHRMPHVAADLEIFARRLAEDRERHVASLEFSAGRARRGDRIHFGGAERVVAPAVSGGSSSNSADEDIGSSNAILVERGLALFNLGE